MAIYPKEKFVNGLFRVTINCSRLLFPNAPWLSAGLDLAYFEVIRYVFGRNSGSPREVLQK